LFYTPNSVRKASLVGLYAERLNLQAMAESYAKQRLESLSRHLTPTKSNKQEAARPKFELEDHTVEYVRPLRVRDISNSACGRKSR
jgi:hypothetical protein